MFFFFKQKTAYEMRISDWSSDVCSSDLLDGATGDGVYTLPFDIGKRSRFGGIETTGDLAFDAEHVEVLARFKRGDLYDSRMVDDLRQALVATGLFATVAAEPQPTGERARSEEHQSELQSLMRSSYAVFCWKKKKTHNHNT